MKTLISRCLSGLLLAAAHAAQAVEQDHTVSAGRGLESVYIGQESTSAMRSLGTPRESLYGFIYLYDLPDGTRLSYRVADKRVESLNLVGGGRSRYSTSRGAKFGMTHAQIEALYGKPDAQVANKIFYNRLGIGFFFIDDKVSEFWVFAPR